MRALPLLAAILAVSLASCSMFEIDKPLLSDQDSDVQVFPLFPDNNGMHPIFPADKVKTEAEAIRIAKGHCGLEGGDDPDHWYAYRDGEVWVVHWRTKLSSIYAEIRKSDGSFEDCQVDDPAR